MIDIKSQDEHLTQIDGEQSMLSIDPLAFVATLYMNNKENEKLTMTLLCQFYLTARKARRYIHTDERFVRTKINQSKNPKEMYRCIRDYQDSIEEKYLFPTIENGYSYITLKKANNYYSEEISEAIKTLDDFINKTRNIKREDVEISALQKEYSELTNKYMKKIVKTLRNIEEALFNELFKKNNQEN